MTSATPAPAPASTLGPKILTFSGVGVLVLALVLGVATALLFVRVLPTGILTSDGRDGPDVVGSVEGPGAAEMSFEADTLYTVLLAQARPGDEEQRVLLSGPVVVSGPDGLGVTVGPAEVSMTTDRGGVHAASVAGFRSSTAGTYTVTAPAVADGSSARLIVVEGPAFGDFFAGVAGVIGGVFLAVGLGLLGLGLGVGGAIWWAVRRKAARRPAPAWAVHPAP